MTKKQPVVTGFTLVSGEHFMGEAPNFKASFPLPEKDNPEDFILNPVYVAKGPGGEHLFEKMFPLAENGSPHHFRWSLVLANWMPTEQAEADYIAFLAIEQEEQDKQ